MFYKQEQAVKDHEVENKYHINYPQEGHHPLAVPLLSIIELKDCRGILGKLRVLDQSCTSEPVNQHSCQEKGGLKLWNCECDEIRVVQVHRVERVIEYKQKEQ